MGHRLHAGRDVYGGSPLPRRLGHRPALPHYALLRRPHRAAARHLPPQPALRKRQGAQARSLRAACMGSAPPFLSSLSLTGPFPPAAGGGRKRAVSPTVSVCGPVGTGLSPGMPRPRLRRACVNRLLAGAAFGPVRVGIVSYLSPTPPRFAALRPAETRPSCAELLQHPYFDGLADWFEPQLQQSVARGREEFVMLPRKVRPPSTHTHTQRILSRWLPVPSLTLHPWSLAVPLSAATSGTALCRPRARSSRGRASPPGRVRRAASLDPAR